MHNISALFGPWLIGFYSLLFVAMAVLYRAAPESRKRLGITSFLAVCSIAGLLASNFFGGPGAGGLVKLAAVVSRLLAVIALVNIAGVFVFSLVLPKVTTVTSKFVEDLILAGAYLAAGLGVISASGANLSGILATSALVTGVVAFSLQDTLGNIIGGMVLHLEDAFVAGDMIKVEGHTGTLREIRWRQSTLATLDGDIIVIPNIVLMKSAVMVLGRAAGNKRFRTVAFNVYYDRQPDEVIQAVEQALKSDPPPGVAPEPAPDCVLKDFQPGCVVYQARYWLTDFSAPGGVDARVRSRVFYALSRAGIKLSVHNRTLVLAQGAEEVAEKGRKDEQAKRLAALKGVYVFQVLTENEKEVLAGRLKSTPFSAGETITRQGSVADWLYIISSGAAEVRIYSEGSGEYRAVKTLGPGDFLGEGGLLTGEPRSATVVAESEVNCFRLDRKGFADILASRPEIAGAIAELLAKRRLELAEARQLLAGENAARGLVKEQQDLLSKIKDFFSLT